MGFRLKAELPADRGRFNARGARRQGAVQCPGRPSPVGKLTTRGTRLRFTGFMQKSNAKPANVEIKRAVLLALYTIKE